MPLRIDDEDGSFSQMRVDLRHKFGKLFFRFRWPMGIFIECESNLESLIPRDLRDEELGRVVVKALFEITSARKGVKDILFIFETKGSAKFDKLKGASDYEGRTT